MDNKSFTEINTDNISQSMSKSTDKKVLISIRDLKQYFPLKNKKGFVKANDGISLDIYEGETLGLVGESGCGKSTLGRVLLQLYHQTDGRTMYYGRSIDSLAPSYFLKTIRNLEKKQAQMNEYMQKKEQAQKDYDSFIASKQVGADANELKEALSIASKKADDAFLDIAQVIGGFLAVKNLAQVKEAFLALYDAAKESRDAADSLTESRLEKIELEGKILAKQAKAADSSTLKTKLAAVENRIAAKQAEVEKKEALLKQKYQEIDKIRSKYAGNKEFEKYEAFRDEGIDLARLTYREMRKLRRDVQLIFQDPYSSLNPRMTVGQIIGEGLIAHKYYESSGEQMQKYITEVMQKCGLAPYMFHRYPHQFSGGQRQRIGIARALAVKPKFVVCDEAVSALDVSIQSQIINLLQDLKEEEQLTYLFISHDLSVVKYISDRIGVMYLGNIVELAKSEDIFQNPSHPYTKALLSAIPTTDVENKKEIIPLEGDIPSPVNPPKGCKFHTRCSYATEICKQKVPEFIEFEPEHFVACHHREQVQKE